MTRVAVVTGGSAGLGRATVRELAARGWDVAVLARGEDGVRAAVAEVEAAGQRGLALVADVADRQAVEDAADRVEAELGPIDLWVNGVMVGVFGRFLDTAPEDFERATQVDYLGFVNGTRAALTRMVPRDSGHVIQVGSALGSRGIPPAGRLLRVEARDRRVHRVGRLRAHRAGQQGADQPGGHAGPQHDPVRVGAVLAPAPRAAGRADLPARGRCPRHRRHRRTPPVVAPGSGESTVYTILANRISGRFADWYAAKTLVSGQQIPDKDGEEIGVNLYEPVPGDHGAHGAFDEQSHDWSPQTWWVEHRRLGNGILGAALGVAGVALATAAGRRR
ncbi:SDR family NAD(P)-dependent oxidoreductase [Curtobacterium sp. MCJR17_043]|uniref:SDR family NAD(P)-dependent oxidoreductase n=1 Tax=Curtobacterium sp. MCJR17_043 TaxID=2175660 RepID=UPI0024DFF935|nr:SDR family NAD(P)-dependent oxidoreductase [Curtobacterium sp. MCJR17_043]WIB36159.1 SDR family NAD(P)-dependent oxidoreductase [Curtobacterium sp. MCJR17_043]